MSSVLMDYESIKHRTNKFKMDLIKSIKLYQITSIDYGEKSYYTVGFGFQNSIFAHYQHWLYLSFFFVFVVVVVFYFEFVATPSWLHRTSEEFISFQIFGER